MSAEYLVVGEFSRIDNTRLAIRTLKSQGHDTNLELFSPFPDHSLEEEMYRGKKRSPVRRFTLLGGLTGCLSAFLFTSWMSIDYPLRVSAKPLVSIPSFVVIAFECTILLGAIFTLLAMFHFSKIPGLFSNPGFRRVFTEGTFGLAVRVSKEQSENVKKELERMGAKAVEVTYVR